MPCFAPELFRPATRAGENRKRRPNAGIRGVGRTLDIESEGQPPVRREPNRFQKAPDPRPPRQGIEATQLTAISETRSFFSLRATPMARGSSTGWPSTRKV